MPYTFDPEDNPNNGKRVVLPEYPEWSLSKRAEMAAENAPTALPSDRGLHVRPDMAEFAPQVVKDSRPTTLVIAPDVSLATCSPLDQPLSGSSDESLWKTFSEPTICGLRRKVFWLLAFITLLLVTGVIVGGTVGGMHVQQNKKQNQSTTTVNEPETVATTSSSSSIPEPTGQAGDGFSLQIWSNPSFQGRTQKFDRPGSFETAFHARSYIFVVGGYDKPTKYYCSVAFCAGPKILGWKGSSSFEQPGFPQNKTWGFDDLTVDCGDKWQRPMCSDPEATALETVPVIESSMRTKTATVSARTSTAAATTTGGAQES